MQTYTRITNEFTGAELPGKIDENLQSLKSNFSGTAFPTENLVEGMTCYRTDLDTEYRYVGGAWEVSGIATQAQAEEGVDNTKVMTPLRVKNAIDKQRPIKTFTSLEQIGLDGNASEVDIASAMPLNSTLMFNAYGKEAFPNLTIPFIGRLKITRWGGETVKFELCRSQADENYVGVVLSINNGFLGWKKSATTDEVLLLSGGTMTGSIYFNGINGVYQKDNTSYINIYGGSSVSDGGVLRVFGKNHESSPGAVAFGALKSDGTTTWATWTEDGLTLANKPLKRYVTQTYRSGYNWYEVYNDGWVRQGGFMETSNTTVTFLKPFANLNYTVYGAFASSSSTSDVSARGLAILGEPKPSSKTQMTVLKASSGNKFWVAEGQGA